MVRRSVLESATDEALIRVAVAGINRPHILQRAGYCPPPPGAGDIPGLEVAGTMVTNDPGSAGPWWHQAGDGAGLRRRLRRVLRCTSPSDPAGPPCASRLDLIVVSPPVKRTTPNIGDRLLVDARINAGALS